MIVSQASVIETVRKLEALTGDQQRAIELVADAIAQPVDVVREIVAAADSQEVTTQRSES